MSEYIKLLRSEVAVVLLFTSLSCVLVTKKLDPFLIARKLLSDLKVSTPTNMILMKTFILNFNYAGHIIHTLQLSHICLYNFSKWALIDQMPRPIFKFFTDFQILR